MVAAVLSGNRNFEGRINPQVKANYLASPPLVVAYALAGTMDIDHDERIRSARIATASRSTCATSGPPTRRCTTTVRSARRARACSSTSTRTPSTATRTGRACRFPPASIYQWDDTSTYIKKPPYFDDMVDPERADHRICTGMRVLALLGDSVTTDHISPGRLDRRRTAPPGKYLISQGVQPEDFNSYGARRGNHEVMVRGTLANIRLRNQLAPGHRRRLDRAPARWRADVHLRCLDEVPEGRRAADDHRRQGIRLRLVARLGGEGRAAAGRAAR